MKWWCRFTAFRRRIERCRVCVPKQWEENRMTGMDAKPHNQPNIFEMLLASGRAFNMDLPDGTHITVPAMESTPHDMDSDVDMDMESTPDDVETDVDLASAPAIACPETHVDLGVDMSVDMDSGDVESTYDTLPASLQEVIDLRPTGGEIEIADVASGLGIKANAAFSRMTRLCSRGAATKAGRGTYVLVLRRPTGQSAAATATASLNPPHGDEAMTAIPEVSPSPPVPVRDDFAPEYRVVRDTESNYVTLSPLPSSILSFYEVENKDIGGRSKREGENSDSPDTTPVSIPSPPPAPTARTKKHRPPRTRCEDCGEYISVRLRQQGSDLCETCRADEEAGEDMLRAER